MIETTDPDVVVLESATGSQVMYTTREGTVIGPTDPRYWSEWEREARELTRIAQSRGALVLWVLPPPVDGVYSNFYGDVDVRMRHVADISRRIAADDPTVGLVDWATVGDAQGNFSKTFTFDGESTVEIRAVDGVHFTPAGSALLSRTTLAQIAQAWSAHGGRP